MIINSFKKLSDYVAHENYRGWDLFDGLNSKIFHPSPFYKIKLLRLAWIQFFKRSPINFRKICLVPKGYNAKGLALFSNGLLAQGKTEEAKNLLDELLAMQCGGYSGISWGYNFDWESRAFFVPMGTPNIVTTVFVANAFLDYYDKTGEESFLHIAEKACDFILVHLILHEDQTTLCFGYIPGESARVHNANMLGAALLARVYSKTHNNEYLEKSRKAMTYAVNALNPDYSWPYGERHHHQFVDNFHTGFNLVALKEWMTFTGEILWESELEQAYKYFIANFWLDNGCPKYYNDSLYPIDIHCSAQGIITCLKLKDHLPESLELARKIALWAIDNMQDKAGFFYYQQYRWLTNKIPYIRWSQAWMFYALSHLIMADKIEQS